MNIVGWNEQEYWMAMGSLELLYGHVFRRDNDNCTVCYPYCQVHCVGRVCAW